MIVKKDLKRHIAPLISRLVPLCFVQEMCPVKRSRDELNVFSTQVMKDISMERRAVRTKNFTGIYSVISSASAPRLVGTAMKVKVQIKQSKL